MLSVSKDPKHRISYNLDVVSIAVPSYKVRKTYALVERLPALIYALAVEHWEGLKK